MSPGDGHKIRVSVFPKGTSFWIVCEHIVGGACQSNFAIRAVQGVETPGSFSQGLGRLITKVKQIVVTKEWSWLICLQLS